MNEEKYVERKYRPYSDLTTQRIWSFARHAFRKGNLEAITYGLYELSHRTERPELYETFQTKLTKKNIRPIRWLPMAYAVSREFKKQQAGGCSVYVVLLEESENTGDYGLYVGQTAHSPQRRFEQHKNDYLASPDVWWGGVMLLPTLFEHLQYTDREEALELEERLAKAFREAGIVTKGGH